MNAYNAKPCQNNTVKVMSSFNATRKIVILNVRKPMVLSARQEKETTGTLTYTQLTERSADQQANSENTTWHMRGCICEVHGR